MAWGACCVVLFLLLAYVLFCFSQLFDRIVVNGSFWVGLVLLWAIVIIKDFYLLTLKYYGFPSDSQILREVILHLGILCALLICNVFRNSMWSGNMEMKMVLMVWKWGL